MSNARDSTIQPGAGAVTQRRGVHSSILGLNAFSRRTVPDVILPVACGIGGETNALPGSHALCLVRDTSGVQFSQVAGTNCLGGISTENGPSQTQAPLAPQQTRNTSGVHGAPDGRAGGGPRPLAAVAG